MDNFNHIILDLHGVDVKIEDEYETLILLCSLRNLYDNFIDNMLFGRPMITMNDVNVSLISK